jgi:putative transposase
MSQVSITYNQQANQLSEIKELRPEYNDLHSQVLQDTLRRVQKAMETFFRRVKNGEKAGSPRFKSYNSFDSFTYPQSGFSLPHDKRVCLSKIGSIKVKLHRPSEGPMKSCSIKGEVDHWFVVFSWEVQATEALSKNNEAIGVDRGVTHFATLSTGEKIENPRHYRRAQKRLAQLQQNLNRKKKGSHRRRKAVKQVASLHRKIRNQRKDFLHKTSRKLVNTSGTIYFEKLNIAGMTHRPKPKQDETTKEYLPNGASAKAGLNKSILDAAWSQFQQDCTYKAESAARTVLFVDPKGTSQRGSNCGRVVKKTLADRWHSCECGTELDRDHNSALEVKRLGSRQQGAIPVEAPGL